MYCRTMILIAGVFLVCEMGLAQESLEELVLSNPARVEGLFAAMDLESTTLAGAKEAVAKKQWAAACDALLGHYRGVKNPAFPSAVDRLAPDPAAIARAEAVLKDTFTFYDQTDTVPRRPEGGLRWDYTGPVNDKEWALALNRHFHLDWLLEAYRMSGDVKYAAAWDAQVRDWILQNPYAEPSQNMLPWRGLEAFFRVRAWARGFYALQNEPAFTPVTRILLLSSIPDHARYLRNFHKSTSNWIAMELNGLAAAGVAWPEFREAKSWVDYSIERLTKELSAQVYPDGAQMELTSDYHAVTMSNFQSFLDLLQPTGRELPPAFGDTIERMWAYLAYTLSPVGYSPLNNDSDLKLQGPQVAEAAQKFNLPDWTYIATNGATGKRPDGLPSRAFPWAGQLVMRSSWDRDAHWAFFDAGPAGIGHQHADKLHLSVAAYGRDILVDSGRYTYVKGDWRDYFVGTASHNTILIDGKGQLKKPLQAEQAIDRQFVVAPEYDLGYGKYDIGFADVEGSATQERLVYYKRGSYWIVVDRIKTDRPRTVTALWHYHPDCTVSVEGHSTATVDASAGNVRIVPSANKKWDVQLVTGQETPEIQGWWSREYNHKTASPTAVYSRSVGGSTTFAWLIVPAMGVPPDAKLRIKTKGDIVDCTVRVGKTREKVRLEFSEEPRVE
ncbi:MAG: alginate lyase family protein [Candidatus Hydrogenedentales bacterium]